MKAKLILSVKGNKITFNAGERKRISRRQQDERWKSNLFNKP